MRVDARKNQELFKQYGFLRPIIMLPLEPFAGEFGDSARLRVDDLTIKVEKADGELMFRQGENTGLGEASCFIGTKGARKDQVGKQGEYLFAVNDQNQIIRRVDWPRNREEGRGQHPPYGYYALWGKQLPGNRHLTDCLYNKVVYLAWVTVSTWHVATRNSDQPFGEVKERSMHITVYGPPEEGFGKLQENSSIEDNLRLTSDVLMRAMFDKDDRIMMLNGNLGELCVSFQDEVFFNGMMEIFDKGEYRGASGQFGPFEALVAEMCGYRRVMLKDNMCWVTYQLRPDSQHMYMLGCNGTLPQIRRLTRGVIEAWRDPQNRSKFTTNKKVGVL